jgi:hypothetical protein
MTWTLRRLLAALALTGAVAACGGGDDGSDDAVASLDDEAAAEDDDAGDDDGGGGGGGGGMTSEEQAEFEDALLEYAQCMRDHGIDMQDPEFDGGRVTMGGGPGQGPGPASDEYEAADEACRPLMEDARPEREPLDPEEQAERQDQLTAMAECMRDRGYDMPDPEVSADGGVIMRGGPGGGGEGGQGGRPDDEFAQDMEECQEEAGVDGPDGGPGLTGSGGGA